MDVESSDGPSVSRLSDNGFVSERTAGSEESIADWEEFIDQLLPDAPDSSKFTKLDFVSPSFGVDSFIEKRKDEPLDQLQHLLTLYASRIRAASVAIISEDHTDLMDFAAQVAGLGQAVDKVLLPLSHAHDEVLNTRNQLSHTMQLLDQRLNRLRQVRKAKSDIEKMLQLNDRLQELESRAQSVESEADAVQSLIASERLKADLMQVERTLQSITTKSKLLFSQKDRFAQIVLHLDRVEHQ